MSERCIGRREVIGAGMLGAAAVAMETLPRAAHAQSLRGEYGTMAAEEVEWDEETDVVVVGSGTAIFAAMLAVKAGKEAVVLEKAGSVGGTLMYSGFGMWVPCNHLMETVDFATHDTPELALKYMLASDANHVGSPERLAEWIERAPKVFQYLDEEIGLRMAVDEQPDYYGYEGCATGRSLHPDYGDSQYPKSYAGNQEVMLPLIEQYGLDVRLNTPAKRLVQDADGRVVGVIAETPDGESLSIKARYGVVLGAGPIDHNPALVKAFYQNGLAASWQIATDTGDGIVMGVEAGAGLDHMFSQYGSLAYWREDYDGLPSGGDAYFDALFPGTIVVNRSGRRIFDESYDYCQLPTNLRALDFRTVPPTANADAFLIADSDFVASCGYPGTGVGWSATEYGSDLPPHIHVYDTLEELAEGEGIDAAGLLDEVERFNGFCETGVDEDFHRGESPYEQYQASWVDTGRGLKNNYLAPIAKPPFYVGKVGPSTFGNSGGLLVNSDYQVLAMRDGEPIPGLYAAGCTAAGIMDTHPGYGGNISYDIAAGLFAVNHMLGLGLF